MFKTRRQLKKEIEILRDELKIKYEDNIAQADELTNSHKTIDNLFHEIVREKAVIEDLKEKINNTIIHLEDSSENMNSKTLKEIIDYAIILLGGNIK